MMSYFPQLDDLLAPPPPTECLRGATHIYVALMTIVQYMFMVLMFRSCSLLWSASFRHVVKKFRRCTSDHAGALWMVVVVTVSTYKLVLNWLNTEYMKPTRLSQILMSACIYLLSLVLFRSLVTGICSEQVFNLNDG